VSDVDREEWRAPRMRGGHEPANQRIGGRRLVDERPWPRSSGSSSSAGTGRGRSKERARWEAVMKSPRSSPRTVDDGAPSDEVTAPYDVRSSQNMTPFVGYQSSGRRSPRIRRQKLQN